MSTDARRTAHSPTTTVGIDIGSTNTKVALLAVGRTADAAGPLHVLGVRSFATRDSAAELVRAVTHAIHGLLSTHPGAPAAVGIASMAESGVLLDRDRRPIGPIVRWTTATAASTSFFDRLGTTETMDLSVVTGVPATRKVPLAAWHRLQAEDPDRWRSLSEWGGVADYLALALTGTLSTDHTLAGRTMAYRLPAHGLPLATTFDDDILQLVGLTASQVPPVLRPGQAAGVITDEQAAKTGLASGTPVYIAGHDHAVAAWAAGVRTGGQAADSVGTTEALVRVATGAVDRRAAVTAGMSVTRTVTGSHECLLSGSSAGAVLARWVAAHPEKDAGALFHDLEVQPPGDSFLLPYPHGRQTPAPDPETTEVLIGRATSAADSLRALLVGLCLQLRWMADSQSRIVGAEAREVRIVGGPGAHNAAWNRQKSLLLPQALSVVDVHEPVAAGAALFAAVQVGAASPDAHFPGAALRSQPHRDANALYDAFIKAATTASTTANAPERYRPHATHP